ncbi:hypothetical protein RYX36_008228, partial [Vicia faba]
MEYCAYFLIWSIFNLSVTFEAPESCKQTIVDGVNLALRIAFLDDQSKLMDKGDGSYSLEKVTENAFDSSPSSESTPSCDYSPSKKEKEKEESGCETVNPSETET